MATSDGHNHDQCARAWHALRLAHRRVELELERALAAGCGLSLHEFDALLMLYLADSGGCRMQDLIGPVPLSQPALSRLISRLEERDLVERTIGSDDGRVILVSLTEIGRKQTSRAIAIHASTIQAELTGHMTAQEQNVLLAILTQVANT